MSVPQLGRLLVLVKDIEPGSHIHIDERQAYKTLDECGYARTTVNHSKQTTCAARLTPTP